MLMLLQVSGSRANTPLCMLMSEHSLELLFWGIFEDFGDRDPSYCVVHVCEYVLRTPAGPSAEKRARATQPPGHRDMLPSRATIGKAWRQPWRVALFGEDPHSLTPIQHRWCCQNQQAPTSNGLSNAVPPWQNGTKLRQQGQARMCRVTCPTCLTPTQDTGVHTHTGTMMSSLVCWH